MQDHVGIHVELPDQEDGEEGQTAGNDPESGKKLKNKDAQNNSKAVNEEKEAKK